MGLKDGFTIVGLITQINVKLII